MSKEQSKPSSRTLLLNAAAELMRDSGYAAVTSRKLAAKAGLKPQLVHYYFKSMDDLFIELYREFAGELMEQQKSILEADNPLRAMWNVATQARGPLLTEFVALANHRKSIQKEITEFGHRFRQSQIDMMKEIFERKKPEGFPWSPSVAALMLNAYRGLWR